MTEFTTMEKLQMKVGPSGAVLKYGEKVLVTCETYYGFTAEVYEFVETPEETGLGYIECRLSLIEKAEKERTESTSEETEPQQPPDNRNRGGLR